MKKYKYTNILRKEINYIKCSIKTTNMKRVENKNRNIEQGIQIEYSNKYDTYYSNYIYIHFECQWSISTN